jgi:hypothetical protein
VSPASSLRGIPESRPPLNVPYVVDNLWEWLRPPEFESRRRSVFAYPMTMMAQASSSGRLETIEVRSNAKVIGLRGPRGAADHADVVILRDYLHRQFGLGWFHRPVIEREGLALYAPVATPREVGEALALVGGSPSMADELRSLSTFWTDCFLVREELEASSCSEVFFAPDAIHHRHDVT